MRQLDACLNLLEDANERRELVVAPSVAARLRTYVPDIASGMSTAEAIELVLGHQEQYLHTAPPGRGPDALALAPALETDADQPLDQRTARELTDSIKHATRQVCMLLLEAHRRRAWSALGYRSWDHYVRAEFSLSRSRSYQLLDQGRVICAIKTSAGVHGILDISAYAAEQIKPQLADVVAIVRARTAERSEPEAREIVADVVQQFREALARDRLQLHLQPGIDDEPDGVAGGRHLVRLYDAISSLASMPTATEAAAQVPDGQAHRLVRLEAALHWLADFAEEWGKRGQLAY